VATYSPVDGYGWVVVERPVDQILTVIYTDREVTLEAILLIMFLAALIGLVVADRVALPLRALAAAAGRLGEGDAAAPLPRTGISEVALLTSLFGRMRDRLVNRTAELQSSEERARLIVDTAVDAVVTMDASGRITGWNNQAAVLFGWQRGEAMGARMADLIIHERLRGAHTCGVRKYLATGEGPILNRRIEITAIRRSGEEFPVELAVTVV
jgi:PAS domain S-box-containing protein